MLTPRRTLTRLAATIGVAAALLLGTVWGQDDHFPFGPFRMYSTRSDPNGEITVPFFKARFADGSELRLRTRDFGLRPSEVNGQTYFIEDDPNFLAHFAVAYERLHPEAPPITDLTLAHEVHQLVDGRPTSYSERVVATWNDQ